MVVIYYKHFFANKEKMMKAEKKEKKEMLKVVKKGRGKSAKATISEACTSRTR